MKQLTIMGCGEASKPTLDLIERELTIESSLSGFVVGIWKQAVGIAFNHPTTQALLIQKLTEEMNKPDTRQSISDALTQYFQQAIDDSLGAIEPGKLPISIGQSAPTIVDQYFFDRARYAVADPANHYYLPKIMYRLKDPTFEPYIASSINVGDQSINTGGIALVFKDFTLENVTITGLSNTTLPPSQLLFEKNTVNATLDISRLNPGPTVIVNDQSKRVPNPPLNIKGTFKTNVEGIGTLTGGITVNVDGAQLVAHFSANGEVDTDLVITFTKVQLKANPNKMRIQLQVDSAFKDLINAIVNQDNVKQKALDGGNQQLESSYDSISHQASENFKKLLSDQLGPGTN